MQIMYISRDALVAWADSRETALVIAEAIFEIASTEAEADTIWQSPTTPQRNSVCARAFDLAGVDVVKLYWGQSTVKRPPTQNHES